MFSLLQNRLCGQLDGLAATGHFDIELLHSIRARSGNKTSKSLRYYLASLYLQLGDTSSADTLLDVGLSASGVMKKFCNVLIYSKQRGYPVPSLSTEEGNCLDYLGRVLGSISFASMVSQYSGILICGNAPGDKRVECPDTWCKLYFNDYLENPRISDAATVHVITPSWSNLSAASSNYLLITGNDIFYRRSNVWKRFIDYQHFQSIFTVPRTLWADMYSSLGSPPSAGLLMLSYVESLLNQGVIAADMPIKIAGYSNNQSGVNHSYDSVPASERHNWNEEKVVFEYLLNELTNRCTNLSV